MTKSTMLLLLVSVAVTSFALWRVHAMNTASVNHFAILQDPSISFTGGCESAVGSAEELLHRPGASARSKLTLFVLGDRATANEPRELGKYAVPTSHMVIEGLKNSERQRATLLRAISQACNSVQRTSISPIFMGVRQAIADLRADGCTKVAQCELQVNSDLEENVEAGIKSGLDRTRSKSPLPRPIENAGIDVTFCGYAATAGQIIDPTGREVRRFARRDPAREDRMQRIWRSVFTSPERVRFAPYCPKPRDPRVNIVAQVSSTPEAR